MTVLKNIMKWIGVVLIGLLLAALILPFVFKDKIIEGLREELNASINAEVSFKDVSISFLGSFPDVEISIDSLSVIGVDSFENTSLLDVSQSEISVSLPSFLNDDLPYLINDISLMEPELNLLISPDSLKNWDIFIPTDSTRNFLIELDQYNISNGRLNYMDQRTPFKLNIDNIAHKGRGTFTADNYDLKTQTSANNINLSYDEIPYIYNADGQLEAIININVPDQKYTFKENELVLNQLPILINGYYQLIKEDIELDLSFKTASNDFKSFLSIIPYAHTKDFEEVITKGAAEVEGNISGTYNDSTRPAFAVQVDVQNGYFKYPTVSKAVENINGQVHIQALQGNYRDIEVDVSQFSLTLDNEEVTGNITIQQRAQNPSVKGEILGNLNIGAWDESFPAESISEMSGVVSMNVDFDANFSDVSNQDYNKIKFNGIVESDSIIVKTNTFPKVSISQISVNASPEQLLFDSENIYCGNSKLKINGSIENPLAYFSPSTELNGNADIQASYLDLNEFKTDSTDADQNEISVYKKNPEQKLTPTFVINFTADSIRYEDYMLENCNLNGSYQGDKLEIEALSLRMDQTDLYMKGQFNNIPSYMTDGGVLEVSGNMKSKFLDLNSFMSPNSSKSQKIILIPDDIVMNFSTEIDKILYTDYALNNFRGELEIQDGTAAFKNVSTNTLGGHVAFDGLYSTEDVKKPDFSFKFDLTQIQFQEAFQKIVSFQKLAPIAQYIDGVFNSTLVMDGTLGPDMIPDFSSLNATGYLETLNGNLSGDNPISKIGKKLGLDALSKITLEKTRNWFEVVDGMLELKPVKVDIEGISLELGGRHGLGKNMDYLVKMQVPRELLKSNQLTSLAEEGLTFFEQQAAVLGIDMNQGGDVIFDINLRGKLSNPEISIRPSGISGKSASNVVKDAIDDKVETVKDSLESEINETTEEIMDSIKTTTNTVIDSAKNVIETQAEEVLDTIKSNIETQFQEVVGDTLKQIGEEIIKDVIDPTKNTSIDSIKSQLEQWNPFKKKKKEKGR